MRYVSRFASALVLGLALGCSGAPDYRKMDAREKAKLVKQLGDNANYQFDLFQKSQNDPDGVNEKALFEYRDSLHQITEIMGPTDFPLAYANYGGALTRVGMYYRSLVAALEKELETTKPSMKGEIRSKIDKYTAEAMKSFAASNRQYDVYFQNAGATIDPKVYRWALGNSEALGDWKNALGYLELLEASGWLSEQGKKEVAQLRKDYTEALRRQEEKELERELNKTSSPRDDSRARGETAN